MRRLPAVIAAAFLCACNPSGGAGDPEGTDGGAIAENRTGSAAPAAARASPDSAATPAGAESPAGNPAAELQRLAAAGQPVLLGTGEEVSAGEFEIDEQGDPSAYAGSYHFGDSEGESNLGLAVEGNAVTGRLGYSDWENETWVGKELRLDGGRIDGARLTAPGWSGVFVRHQGRPGLLILRAPADRLGVEFGEKEEAS